MRAVYDPACGATSRAFPYKTLHRSGKFPPKNQESRGRRPRLSAKEEKKRFRPSSLKDSPDGERPQGARPTPALRKPYAGRAFRLSQYRGPGGGASRAACYNPPDHAGVPHTSLTGGTSTTGVGEVT
jgi:hypothetical protein